jgi:hypothetical protein
MLEPDEASEVDGMRPIDDGVGDCLGLLANADEFGFSRSEAYAESGNPELAVVAGSLSWPELAPVKREDDAGLVWDG